MGADRQVIDALSLIGGLIYLLMGGDLLVRGAAALSHRARVPPIVVGLTVVSFGTSAPELVVSIQAVFARHPGLALGNIVGSNIANVLLVVGVPAIIAPLICNHQAIVRDTVIMIATSVFFFSLCILGPLGRIDGALLLAGLGLYLLYNYKQARVGQKRPPEPGELERVLGLPHRRRMIAVFLIIGVLMLPLGANLLIEGATGIASRFGVPETVIGLTIIAVGTSLPELATTLAGAFQGHAAVALGNVIGSNVINLLAIMGAAAALSPEPIPIPAAFLRLDLPVMIAAALALAFFTLRRAQIGRTPGIVLTGGYVVYLGVLAIAG
jgi:cation:H+ antiporter